MHVVQQIITVDWEVYIYITKQKALFLFLSCDPGTIPSP